MNEIITPSGKAISGTPFERARLLTERIKAKSRELWQDLKTMRDEELYKELGYTTIEEWAEGELGWTRRHVYYQIKAAEIIGLLESSVNESSHLPTHETQVRHLGRLEKHKDYNDGELIVEAWQEACHLAGEKPPTEKDVRFVVDELMYVEPPPLPEGEYNVIYADPPWEFDNAGFEQSAASHYPTMATTKIAELAIPKSPVLFLWATSAMLEDALFVMKEWGYQYKTNLVWAKDKGPSIGWFATSRHELLLIGTSESGAHPLWKPVSWLNAGVTQHSRKPDEFYEVIEKMYDGPYLEMFARRERDGWEAWGNEV